MCPASFPHDAPTPAGRADPPCAADRGRGRRPRGGGRAVDAVPNRPSFGRAVTDLDRRLRQSRVVADSGRHARRTGLRRARAALAALPVKGWDRDPGLQALPVRQGLERRRQRGVRAQRVQHPRRHPAPRPGRPGGARRHLLRADRDPARPVHRNSPSSSFAGPDTSDGVQIDHLVSLADAWYKGAREWDDQRRLDFANDPRNLLAVSAKANFDKAFRDAASWLPPNEASGASSSPARSTSRPPTGCGFRPRRSGRWPRS